MDLPYSKVPRQGQGSPIIILWIALTLFSNVLFAQSANDVLENYFKVVSNGDINNWDKIKTAYLETSDTFVQPGNQNVPSLLSQKGSRQKMYRVWPDMSMTEVFDDTVVSASYYHVKGKHFLIFKQNPPIPLPTGPYEPYFEFEPVMVYHALKKNKQVENLGLKNIGTCECFDIKIVTKNLIWHFYINPDNSLLEYWSNSTDGEETTITRVFNYAKIDNYLIPLSESKSRDGHDFFWSKRNVVKLNIPIDPNKFVYTAKGN
ncbi:MAG: hypothetical protein WDO14_12990 [Bacteroidota bacterium]